MKTKLFKRVGILAMTAVMSLSLAACGDKGDSKGAEGGKDPTATVTAATEKLNGAKSFHADLLTEITMSMGGESVDMDMTISTDTFTDPMKAKLTMSSTGTGSADLPETQLYLQADGEGYTVYLENAGQWITQTLSAQEAAQFDPKNNAGQYLDYVKSYTAAGTETIGSVEAERYDGAITGKDISEVFKTASASNGSMQSFSAMMSSLPDPSIIEDLSGLQMSIWGDPATGYPVRQQLDMGPFMIELMDAVAKASNVSAEDLGVKVDAALVTVDYSNFDAVEEFEIPAEAMG